MKKENSFELNGIDLLDDIASANDYYLSDLRRSEVRENVLPYILTIEEDQYNLHEWQEALNYLTESNIKYGSVGEYKEEIKKFVENK